MFYEISFPIASDYGTSGGFLTRTVLNETQGGDFTPQSIWDEPIHEFTIECSSYAPGDFDKVNAFFLLMRGKNKGFRFKVPNDYTGTNEFIGVGDGTVHSFQLVRNYDSVTVPYAIVFVDEVESEVLVTNADVSAMVSGTILSISGSTENDGYYVSQGAEANPYVSDAYGTSAYTFTGLDYTGEFTVNQKVLVSHGGAITPNYVRSCVVSGSDTILTLKTAVSGGAAGDVIYANTLITVSPPLAGDTIDGNVNLFVSRNIVKPVLSAAVTLSVDGTEKTEGTHYFVDYTTGIITFASDSIPAEGERIVAIAFEYDIPVLMMSDKIEASFDDWEHATFSIPIKEWRNPS